MSALIILFCHGNPILYVVYLRFAHKMSILMAVNFLFVDIKWTEKKHNKRQNSIMLTCKRPAFGGKEEEGAEKKNQNKKEWESRTGVNRKHFRYTYLFIHAHYTAQYAIRSVNFVFDLHTCTVHNYYWLYCCYFQHYRTHLRVDNVATACNNAGDDFIR